MIVFIAIIAVMIFGYGLRLYKLSITEEVVAADNDTMTYITTVEASRGNILDRNGNVLVSNRASYNLTIINFVLFNSDSPNDELLSLLELCDSMGIQYKSHFPVTPTRPYDYDMESIDSSWQGYFRKFLSSRDYDLDTSAATLMKNLRKAYRIPNTWDPEQAYKVISVRYELELRSIKGVGLENYTLASDVDAESLAAIMELGVPGVIVESGTVREYNTKYAAHILGTIGDIYAEEYEEYKAKGYAMNAKVGKTGVEQAFEEYLHPKTGTKYTTVSSTGEVLREYYTSVPEAGNNVELSIDISLQGVAEDALEKLILNLREKGVGKKSEGKDAEGGAVVVQSVKTGEILACASYPTFNIATFNQDYKELEADPYKPLFNRALAAYPPGSVYKMVTAIADVDLGDMSPYYEIEDEGIYLHYKDDGFTPKCHVWSPLNPVTHGVEDLRLALADSCNYYFYESGRLTWNKYYAETHENPFDVIAKGLGLGEPSGIELYEQPGVRANRDTKAAMYEGTDAGWYAADILQAVIGQSLNKFTPVQLVNYCATLANNGTRYASTFLSRIVSWDYQELIKQHEPTILSTLEISDEAMAAVKDGMHLTATYGTAEKYLSDYPIDVCCKTGTAQWQGTTSYGGFGGSDHASFVLFAPMNDPEIAIAIYVEKGSQGGNLANVAIPILDAYFSTSTRFETALTEYVAN